VAAGALETPRVLLNSADERRPRGLANSSGRLGRYLQDHVKVLDGGVLPDLSEKNPPLTVMALADRRTAHLGKGR
jgi:choline dehydrogenase-like flavoprotein